MKKMYLVLLCCMSMILFSCQEEMVSPEQDSGSLSIDIGLSININEVNKGLKSAQALEDFKVIIYAEDDSEVLVFENLSAMPDTLELHTGNYYVVAHSDNNLPAAFENPYYYGESEIFTISSKMHQSLQIACKLANTIVSVVYSDEIQNSFTDYYTKVSSTLDSLIYTKGETRLGYFQPLPLDILVKLDFLNPDGSANQKTLSGSIPDPLANRHYEIFVNTQIDDGLANFQIYLDSTEIPIDQIEIADNTEIPSDNAIAYGELLITEIMKDPSALSDTEGEWFEIYNHSARTINLQNLILQRDETNYHTITENIDLGAGEYFVFARTDLATDVSNKYIYGTDILLPNTGANLAIYNKDSENGPGSIIFSLNYGNENFPSQSGTSISLNPDIFNANDAVLGTSWCLSTSVYSTGDLGTPGLENDNCE